MVGKRQRANGSWEFKFQKKGVEKEKLWDGEWDRRLEQTE